MDSLDPTADPEADLKADPEAEAGDEDDVEEVAPDLVTLSDILPFSQYRVIVGEWEKPPSDRVQFALDCALIAAAERVVRMLRSDLRS